MPVQVLCTRVRLATVGLWALVLLVGCLDHPSFLLWLGGHVVELVLSIVHVHTVVVCAVRTNMVWGPIGGVMEWMVDIVHGGNTRHNHSDSGAVAAANRSRGR